MKKEEQLQNTLITHQYAHGSPDRTTTSPSLVRLRHSALSNSHKYSAFTHHRKPACRYLLLSCAQGGMKENWVKKKGSVCKSETPAHTEEGFVMTGGGRRMIRRHIRNIWSYRINSAYQAAQKEIKRSKSNRMLSDVLLIPCVENN